MNQVQPTPAPAKHLVITGAGGEIAAAVERAAREAGWNVTALRRGDDIVGPLERADAVAVLDGAQLLASSSDYAIAMQAVAEAIRPTALRRIVSVTLAPPRDGPRRAFLDRAQEVERELGASGTQVTAIRCSLVVGTPSQDGPLDAQLTGMGGSRVLVPGDGQQRVRPILIDDLASIVSATIAGATDAPELIAEGPETMGLAELVRRINGDGVTVMSQREWRGVLRGLLAPHLAIGSAQLPPKDHTLSGDELELPHAPRPVGAAWTEAAQEERRQRLRRKRSVSLYRATTATNLVAVFLVVVGAVGVGVGGHDAAATKLLADRVTALALVVLGAFACLSGALLLRRSWADRYVFGFLGAVLTTLLLGVVTAQAWASADAASEWRAGLTLLAVTALMSSIALARRGGLAVAKFLRAQRFATLQTLVLGSASLAFIQFLWSSLYVPSTANPTVTVTATLEPSAPVGNSRPLKVHVTLANESEHTVNVLAASYGVVVARIDMRKPPGPTTSGTPARQNQEFGALGRVRDYSLERDRRPIEVGTLVDSGTFLEPKESISRTLIVLAPPSAELARLDLDIDVARRGFEEQIDYTPIVEKWTDGHRYALDQALIHDPSWLHEVTRGDRWIHIAQSIEHSALPFCVPARRLITWIDNHEAPNLPGAPCEDDAGRLANHYGLTTTGTSVEIPLPPPEAEKAK